MHWKLLLSLLLAVVSFVVVDARRVAEVRAAAEGEILLGLKRNLMANILALEISVPEAVAIFIKDELYDLCAEFLHKPVYARTSTVFRTVTSDSVISVTTTAANKKTVTEGTVLVTVTKIVTATTTNFFYTETDDFYSFSISTTTTRTTAVGTTTIYTNKVKPRDDSEALYGRGAQFPSALREFTSIISSACSSLLALHTKTTTSIKTSIHFLTSTATATLTATVPAHTLTKSKSSTTTSTQQLLSVVSIIIPLTATDTATKTIYTATTTVSSQCAPTAYVGNALEYSDSADIHFDLNVPDQKDTVACCELCVNRPDCQVWIFYSQMVDFGRCLLVTGATAGVCPAKTFNSGFLPPLCTAHTISGVDIGYGSCVSNIMITDPTSPEGCILGEN